MKNLRILVQGALEFNATGRHVVSPPIHRSSDGLPVGMQLVARLAEHATLLAVAARLEADSGGYIRSPAP